MTGFEFEKAFCEHMKKMGFWVKLIPREKNGSQPFDVIAMSGDRVYMLDCKVCSSYRFPLSRVEDNQWLAFRQASEKTNAMIGLAVYSEVDGSVYYVSYAKLTRGLFDNEKSIKLNVACPWFRLGEEEV